MKVVEKFGNLFTATETVIGHGANCEGRMGAGVAKQFKARFPDVYEDYYNYCIKGKALPGYATLHPVGPDRWVANLLTQQEPGPNARLLYIVSSLVTVATSIRNTSQYMVPDYKIAIPRIGCGIGGLTWSTVKSFIENCGLDDFTVVVYTYSG